MTLSGYLYTITHVYIYHIDPHDSFNKCQCNAIQAQKARKKNFLLGNLAPSFCRLLVFVLGCILHTLVRATAADEPVHKQEDHDDGVDDGDVVHIYYCQPPFQKILSWAGW